MQESRFCDGGNGSRVGSFVLFDSFVDLVAEFVECAVDFVAVLDFVEKYIGEQLELAFECIEAALDNMAEFATGSRQFELAHLVSGIGIGGPTTQKRNRSIREKVVLGVMAIHF